MDDTTVALLALHTNILDTLTDIIEVLQNDNICMRKELDRLNNDLYG